MTNKLIGVPSFKSIRFTMLLLILQITVYFVIYADVPIARMIVCFLYLTFVPGMVILKLLALENLDITEKVLFSVGLSIAFLMSIGIMINSIAGLAVSSPLSLNFLILSINSIILLVGFVGSRHDDASFVSLPKLRNPRLLFLILLFVSLFLLGSIGIVFVNSWGNSFLLLLILTISIIVSMISISEKTIPSEFYPLILLAICICVLFFVSNDTSLITKYITGRGDQWIEYYAFRLTEIGHYWNPAFTSSPYTPDLFPTYSMMSVTILPLVFSTITGLDSSSIFKFLYPAVVSFLALGAYKLYKTQTDSKVAFLGTFFLITVSVGKGWGSDKQLIAQLFYVSLFLLFFKKDLSHSQRYVLFAIFGGGLVLSHYALSYIFLLTAVFAFLVLALMEYSRTGRFSIYQIRIPLALVMIFSTTVFSWYIYVNSSAAFDLLGNEARTIASNLGQFFNPASRGTALVGLGIVETPTIFNIISSAFFILTEILLCIGFAKLIRGKDKTWKFSTEYKVIATLNMVIIAINVLLPKIADTLLMSRFYQTTLIILAPLAVLGGKTIIELIPRFNLRKLYAPLLVLMVFIPLFLFQTGFVYEVTKTQSYSVLLSMNRLDDLYLYSYIVDAQEVAGAQWIPKHANTNTIFIYSDPDSQHSVLTAYGMIEKGRVYYLSNTTRPTSNELVYLANVNLINKGYIFNATEISPILENQNRLYTNGECEIYEGCTP